MQHLPPSVPRASADLSERSLQLPTRTRDIQRHLLSRHSVPHVPPRRLHLPLHWHPRSKAQFHPSHHHYNFRDAVHY